MILFLLGHVGVVVVASLNTRRQTAQLNKVLSDPNMYR
jgi:hypothetical protein